LKGYVVQGVTTALICGRGRLLPQKPLNAIPTKFDARDETLKGEEVFSNVGRVARGFSLRRFIAARDDNQ